MDPKSTFSEDMVQLFNWAKKIPGRVFRNKYGKIFLALWGVVSCAILFANPTWKGLFAAPVFAMIGTYLYAIIELEIKSKDDSGWY